MKKLLINLKPLIITNTIVLMIALFLVFLFDKERFYLSINQTNSFFQDLFFKNIRNLGDGLFGIFLILISAFFLSYRSILIGISSFLIAGISCQINKNVFASSA